MEGTSVACSFSMYVLEYHIGCNIRGVMMFSCSSTCGGERGTWPTFAPNNTSEFEGLLFVTLSGEALFKVFLHTALSLSSFFFVF